MLTFLEEKNIKFIFSEDINQLNSVSTSKRLFDIAISFFVIIFILSWMVPLIGIVIKLTSPGPIFFKQLRTGLNGTTFECLKFRSMFHQCNQPFQQAVYNDVRITSIGRWLRKTNIDEMPQFLNVIVGQMSIVGPRPHAIQHDAEFLFRLPEYYKRYTILPGITGLAQVSGARGITDDLEKMEQRLQYDLLYIERCSFWYDVQICWHTLKSMILGNTNAW